MGAYFIMVTSVPGVRPMSKICCRSAWSSDATDATTASFPISSASSLTSAFLPRRPQGVAFMFTMANRLPWLTNLSMHDSANTQRCSIDRSVQWGQVALPNRCDAEQPGAGGDSGTRFPRRHPFGNRTPLFRRIPGCSFPMGAPGETASHSETLKRDGLSD